MNRFEERVAHEITGRRLFDAGARVVCAVSGGADSTALARVLFSTRESVGISGIVIAHFDHRIRPESGNDAEWVREFAEGLGLEHFGGSADVPALQKAFRLSPEEAARVARRDFLLRVQAEAAADVIALGHQMTDRAETFFMRLIRGAGTRGLGAMRWRDEAGFVRPLLWATRREITGYLDEIGQSYLEDPTNEDVTYTRNFIRHEVFPVIESDFPGAVRKMAEAAEAFTRDDEALEELARAAVDKYVSDYGSGRGLDDKFRVDLTLAVAARLVQIVYELVGKGRRTLERSHIEAVLSLGEGSTVNLPGGCGAERSGGVTGFRPSTGPGITSWSARVAAPGEVAIPGVGYRVSAGQPDVSSAAGYVATLDQTAVGKSVIVRSRCSGDCIRPVGLGGTRKLQDVFVDAKVRKESRVLYPVIATEDEVLAVPGLAVAERAAPRPGLPTITVAIDKYGGNSFDGRDG
jgi:tRNA(Ile)-lysidine synthase